MTPSRAIAEAYLAARSAIGDEARHAATIALADGLAVIIAATGLEPAVKPFMTHAAALGAGDATLIGQGASASPVAAALANGALAHAVDFEDTFETGKIHPNASLIPAVLALAESEAANGEAIIGALALGCDFACRLSLALDGDPARRGWYHPPILSGLGATLGCSLLLSLDAAQTVSAFGLFLSQFLLPDELKRSPRSHLRAVREGLAARAAVDSALLARAGVVAVEQPLEGQSGLFALLTGSGPRPGAFDDIGSSFFGPDVGIKRWPACRGTHSAIVVAQRLKARGVIMDDIAGVAVTVSPPNDMLFVPHAQRICPQTAIDAKFSIPFVFSAAMADDDVQLASFAPARLADERLLRLAAAVEMAGMLGPDGPEAVYEVTLRGGEVLSEPVEPLPAWPAGSLALDDLRSKITACIAAGKVAIAPETFLKLVADVVRAGASPLMSALAEPRPN
jgi:Uncharacterized protein involved in propionate catabolism